ncbi:MAG: nuclear transport factor 2 family protein [Actinomycetota bacterium]|nr:nuclear transport factor 2 family protein [Actinomycetota bacterium]
MADPLAAVQRAVERTNDHDLEGLLRCFEPGYVSEQPAHPARRFEGIDQVRKNWGALLEAVPDIRWEIIRTAADDDTAWAEVQLTGTRADGSPLEEQGVIIFGVADGKIAWARLYLEEIEQAGGDIDATVERMAGSDR